MDCTICNETKEGAPKIELLCRHSFHTECWISQNIGHGLNGIRCRTCTEYIVPDELHLAFTHLTQVHETDKSEIINYLLESDEEFRNTLIDIRKANSKQGSYLKKLYSKVKHELKNEDMLTHVSILKNKLKELKSEIKESEEYKNLSSADRSYVAKTGKLFRQWGINLFEVRRALINNVNERKYLSAQVSRMRTARIMRRIRYNIYA
jgi:hypothetical protein